MRVTVRLHKSHVTRVDNWSYVSDSVNMSVILQKKKRKEKDE